jgi:hypothetical protein
VDRRRRRHGTDRLVTSLTASFRHGTTSLTVSFRHGTTSLTVSFRHDTTSLTVSFRHGTERHEGASRVPAV